MNPVLCPYCKNSCRLLYGKEIAPNSPSKWSRRFWACEPCRAHVGAHKNGEPMGRPAKGHVRYARMLAHDAFDKLWRNPREAGFRIDNDADHWVACKQMREHCYRWLADILQMTREEEHISMMMDVPLLQAVREMALAANPADIRARYPSARPINMSLRRRGRRAA